MERITRMVLTRTPKQNVVWVGETKVIVETPCAIRVIVEAPENVRIDRGEIREKLKGQAAA